MDLDSYGKAVRIGKVRLRTPGLKGTVTRRTVTPTGLRGPELKSPISDDVLARNQILVEESVELESRETGTRDDYQTRHGEPALLLQANDPGPGWGQFVLATDEAGIIGFEFAPPAPAAPGPESTRGGGAPREYLIRWPMPDVPDTDRSAKGENMRGIGSYLGKKVLEVLIFPLIDPALRAAGTFLAANWEKDFRPYRLRGFSPDDYRTGEVEPLAPADWERLQGGRALLLIHGTFSRGHEAFADLPRDDVARLHGLYGGRIFALDHFTLSEDPRQNADWFFAHVPDGTRLDVDIVCHSRGGLVARSLVERQSEFSLGGRALRVDRVVHVGVPNAGTPLSDAPHLNDLIESYANILTLAAPDEPAHLLLDGLFTVAKELAVQAMEGLVGLQAMFPQGPFLRRWPRLDPVPDVRYFAMASEYRPTNSGLLSWATDRLLTKAFRGAPNDLVVPTPSVYDPDGTGLFPIVAQRRHVFGPADGVTHVGYFAHPRARETILGWLAAR